MRGRSLGVLLPAWLLLVGCAGSSGAGGAESSSLIYGVVTDSDHQGLVASYIGGACDGPAHLAVTETASRIEVTVNIEAAPGGPRACPAVGYSRTVAARLAQPIGSRPIFSGAHRQVPFDGSRRLLPSALPPNFEKVGPAGTDDFTSGWTAAGTATIAGHLAGLWRAGSATSPTGWAYSWKADRGSVEVVAQDGCQGDRILDAAELLEVAQSLQPE